jgi:hypothetical protein
MRREWDETRLREAFLALSESEEVSEGNVDTLKVWKAVAGELGVNERLEVIDKVALEPGYAEAWRLATELFDAQSQEAGPVATSTSEAGLRAPGVRTPSRSPYILAAAAVLLVGFLGVIVSRSLAPREPIYRGAVVVPLTGAEESLPRNDFRLRWQAPEGSRFDIRVTTEDLWILDTASGLTSPEYVVPAERLEGLAAESKVFWQVEAKLPDGSVVQSGTFITEVK